MIFEPKFFRKSVSSLELLRLSWCCELEQEHLSLHKDERRGGGETRTGQASYTAGGSPAPAEPTPGGGRQASREPAALAVRADPSMAHAHRSPEPLPQLPSSALPAQLRENAHPSPWARTLAAAWAGSSSRPPRRRTPSQAPPHHFLPLGHPGRLLPRPAVHRRLLRTVAPWRTPIWPEEGGYSGLSHLPGTTHFLGTRHGCVGSRQKRTCNSFYPSWAQKESGFRVSWRTEMPWFEAALRWWF